MADAIENGLGLGPCDVLVAAAGQAEPGRFLDLEPGVFRRQMELNYSAALNAVRAVLPVVVERARCHITADRQTRIIARLADLHGPPIRAGMRWHSTDEVRHTHRRRFWRLAVG